jgi:hypothetical protein
VALMLSLGISICSPAVWANGAFVPSSASTAALLAALTGVYSRSLKQAWDDAIGASETDGSWADFDILYPKGAIPGTSAANISDGYINWKNPAAFTLTPINSPTNGNGYWQGDGSSSRLRTGYNPTTDGVKFTQDDASIWVWSNTDGTSVAASIGNVVSPQAIIYPMNTDNKAYGRVNSASAFTGNVTDGIGLYCVQRRAAGDVRMFKNGSQIANSTTASTGLANQEQWICGANSSLFGTRKIMFGAWGAKQEGRESAIYSRWQTVFTAAGTI